MFREIRQLLELFDHGRISQTGLARILVSFDLMQRFSTCDRI